MKKTIVLVFIGSSFLLAAETTFVCSLKEGKSGAGEFPQEKRLVVEPSSKENIVLRFDSNVSKKIKIEGRYSPMLNSIDAEITDLRSHHRALSTDWFNSKGQTAHASIIFNTPQGEGFILQCTKHFNP